MDCVWGRSLEIYLIFYHRPYQLKQRVYGKYCPARMMANVHAYACGK